MAQAPMIQKINREQNTRDLKFLVNEVIGPGIAFAIGFFALVYAPAWMPMVKILIHNLTA